MRRLQRLTAPFLFLAACGQASTSPDSPINDAPQADSAAVFGTPNAAAGMTVLPGVVVTSAQPQPDGSTFYTMTFKQQADHTDPSRGTFEQRLTLIHHDAKAPLVLWTCGYDVADGPYALEPTVAFAANQLAVEHRFYATSRPADNDWKLDTIAQSTADLHAVVQTFKAHYPGKWISTGASKDGMTATYHRQAFPDDVDATIAYVAPLMLGQGTNPLDKRMNAYLDTAGTPACRANLHAFREAVLADPLKSAVLSTAQTWATNNKVSFTLLAPQDPAKALQRAFEYTVIELNYTLWQYFGERACDAIPTGTAITAQSAFNFLMRYGLLAEFSDAAFTGFESFYYEALTQLSYYEEYYGPDDSADVITDKLDFTPSWNDWLPPGTAANYDPAPMLAIQHWAQADCKNVIFVYGENDPYTAAAYNPGAHTNCQQYIAPAGNHGSSIYGSPGLVTGDQTRIAQTLQAWLGLTPNAPGASAARDTPATAPLRRRPL